MKISRRFWLVLTFSYMLAILWSSTIPSSSDTEGFSKRGLVMDLLHIPAYSILAYFFLRTFCAFRLLSKDTGSLPFMSQVLVIQVFVFTAAVCFGIFNEFVQAHVPGREFSIGDMLRNALGAGLALFFYRYEHDRNLS
ncbi:MAG: VanZ family protein [Candidatus Omnitrophota bacterium]|jgi:VanZ family protein